MKAPSTAKKAYHFATYIFSSLFSFAVTTYAIFSWFDHPVADFISYGIVQPLLSSMEILTPIHQSITFDGFLGIMAVVSTALGLLFARDAYKHFKYWINPETPASKTEQQGLDNEKADYYAEAEARRFASWILLSLLFLATSIIAFSAIAQHSYALFVAQELFTPICAAFKLIPSGAAITTGGLITIAAVTLALAVLCAIPSILTVMEWLQAPPDASDSEEDSDNDVSADSDDSGLDNGYDNDNAETPIATAEPNGGSGYQSFRDVRKRKASASAGTPAAPPTRPSGSHHLPPPAIGSAHAKNPNEDQLGSGSSRSQPPTGPGNFGSN